MSVLAWPRTPRRLATLACALALAGGAAAQQGAREIVDPHYGDTLFHFFQDEYFTALTTLTVSQHFGRVPQHADEAELLRAGMLLSYGLPREAGAIFARLSASAASVSVRDRAWYFQAKISYQRGYLAAAQQALAQVQGTLAPPLQEDHVLLQANVLMALGDHAGAARLLQTVDAQAPGARYARFNLGVALIQSGDDARGNAVLQALGQAGAPDEETRSLRDRANLALGFAALRAQQPLAARSALERVRLQGPEANKALLGLGWAAAALKEPRAALLPWSELAQRGASDSAALEAHIAVAYAYAELGAYGPALQRYQQAISAFEREHAELDESIAALRSGALVDALLQRNPGADMGWFWSVRELPALAHPQHLLPVLAQHDFQEGLKNLRDLRFLGANLQDWHDKLGVFDAMLATRSAAFSQRLPELKQHLGQTGLPALRVRADALRIELRDAQAAADGAAFANPRELDLMARAARLQAAVNGPDPELGVYRERVRVATGALVWQLAQDYPERLWTASRGLQDLDRQLLQAQRGMEQLAQAQRDEPARFDAFGQRIRALAPLLQERMTRVAALDQEQRLALQDIAVAALTRQQERLGAYSTQARYALAQLYDRARDPAHGLKETEHAPK